ncbi:hypothetical protein PGT21_031998 [Puccinia graminis f. sp. tritici]|uniref:Uncharacterized protein n=1 Tax=Puccinia graminis f. sp. tritici TaxID=56615 RepID=A0A5B0R6R7_PUCGR|nr:hypothetical protein PGT21_031998 [Puccinia graminis f. sp. tritici]KAA1120614.1 hypothetical protein PGTUg99_010177 [Puccinia graminis f. sp. tritici]
MFPAVAFQEFAAMGLRRRPTSDQEGKDDQMKARIYNRRLIEVDFLAEYRNPSK